MTKLVNLDDLAATKRQVTFRGKTHEVLDLALKDFIEFQKDFDTLIAAQTEGDMAAMTDVAELIVTRCVPTFTDLRELNMRQTMALVQLIADFYPTDAEEATQGNGE